MLFIPLIDCTEEEVDRVKWQQPTDGAKDGWVPPVAVETRREPVLGRWLMMAMTSTIFQEGLPTEKKEEKGKRSSIAPEDAQLDHHGNFM